MPRPGRAYWKGFLRLSLVSIPVEIFTAVETAAAISLNQIHKPTGRRINYTKTVQGVGPVETADIVKGFEVDKDVYVTLEPDEIEALKVESKRTLDLTQFIDAAEIDPRYFEKPYYVVPADEQAAEGYLVIREALAGMRKLGLGQITMSGREHIVAVGPVEKGLVMEVLRYAGEIRSPSPYFSDLPSLKLDKEMVALARELIAKKAAPFEPAKFHDSYADAMRALIAEKAKGKRIVAKPSPAEPQGKVVDLLDALRRSLKTGEASKRGKAPQRRAS
ncbi:Ku protein [Aestuariivirga litoralis]|uniref:Non-homologous end joining protein Ku n=1 Tax=Aestuariivirga litoralis TaxID=2650924 RepID=A0A2W2AUI4_9HYPH|nr:Ku protein [Aestuariivirga litoralis]PZF76270.1 Ku protein [Aestuariivirga litoralis]